jgi:hypothetical protein
VVLSRTDYQRALTRTDPFDTTPAPKSGQASPQVGSSHNPRFYLPATTQDVGGLCEGDGRERPPRLLPHLNRRPDPQLQNDALNAAGCWNIWTDVASGAKNARPQLAAVLDALRPSDTLVVWELDRLGRSMSHLLATVQLNEQKGAGFRSLTEQIDTTTSTGRLILERSAAGKQAARVRGRNGGRPHAMTAASPAPPGDWSSTYPGTGPGRTAGKGSSTRPAGHQPQQQPDYPAPTVPNQGPSGRAG